LRKVICLGFLDRGDNLDHGSTTHPKIHLKTTHKNPKFHGDLKKWFTRKENKNGKYFHI
jgi:hypothetical protein